MQLSLNFLSNKTDALIAILILAVGSISIAATSQFVMGQDGDTLKNLLGGRIYGACKDTKITSNVTNGILGGCIYGACENTKITGLGQSGGGQPTPTTGTLTVIKKLNCEVACRADQFKITVTGNNVSISKQLKITHIIILSCHFKVYILQASLKPSSKSLYALCSFIKEYSFA